MLSQNTTSRHQLFAKQSELPRVIAMIAIYNEEKVIAQKLKTLLQSNYPSNRLEIYVGSDCSTDQSNTIVQDLAKAHPNLHFHAFEQRSGKPGVLNKLADLIFQQYAPDDELILLLTDANVMLAPDTIFHLVKHFKEKKIALVDANMTNTGAKKTGISRSEKTYVSSEVLLKNWEGRAGGLMMGPFGGCFALRASHFVSLPPNFLVDDFYIAMKSLERGGLAINDLDAVCYESLSHELREEYRRKSRISAGNFQNLNHFRHLLWPPYRPIAFRFWSHKVLRWLGPFFIIFALLSNGVLGAMGNQFFLILFGLQLLIMVGVPVLDFILKRLNINWLLLRNLSYFLFMNLALLEGFFKYLNGIKNNVWQPSQRQ